MTSPYPPTTNGHPPSSDSESSTSNTPVPSTPGIGIAPPLPSPATPFLHDGRTQYFMPLHPSSTTAPTNSSIQLQAHLSPAHAAQPHVESSQQQHERDGRRQFSPQLPPERLRSPPQSTALQQTRPVTQSLAQTEASSTSSVAPAPTSGATASTEAPAAEEGASSHAGGSTGERRERTEGRQTDVYYKDRKLVSEAATRAQVKMLERDMGGCDLS